MDCCPFEKNHLIPSSWCSRCISCKGACFKSQQSLSQRENPGNEVWSTSFPGSSLWDKHKGHWERGCGVVWSTMFCILVPRAAWPAQPAGAFVRGSGDDNACFVAKKILVLCKVVHDPKSAGNDEEFILLVRWGSIACS